MGSRHHHEVHHILKRADQENTTPARATRHGEVLGRREDGQSPKAVARQSEAAEQTVKASSCGDDQHTNTTFRDYTNGQTLGAISGRVSALSESEEEGLVAGLIELDVLGFPATRLKLRTLVLKIVSDGRDHRFKATGPGDKWIRDFLEKHKDKLSMRKSRIIDVNRVTAFDFSDIACFFAEYEHYISHHSLPATQIYNCDESGVDPQGGSPVKVIARKSSKGVYQKRGANRESTSVLLAVSASGAIVPPLFIFKGCRFSSDLLQGAPEGSVGTVTDNAFINVDTFNCWIDHFVAHIPPTRPVLLVLDNHVSHIALEVLETCIENGIDVISIPPHTTHLLQPLDDGCFRSFKAQWRKEVSECACSTNADNLPRHLIARLVGAAFGKAWIPGIINGSWSSTGLWPVDRNKALTKPVPSNEDASPTKFSDYTIVEDPLPMASIKPRDLRFRS